MVAINARHIVARTFSELQVLKLDFRKLKSFSNDKDPVHVHDVFVLVVDVDVAAGGVDVVETDHGRVPGVSRGRHHCRKCKGRDHRSYFWVGEISCAALGFPAPALPLNTRHR